MALQPAAGARDLLPRDVEANRWIADRLAEVYRRWGYAEVMPPSIERLDTLEAGGAIDGGEVLRVVADEPLGLRPELTASIARAAGSRLAAQPRPLRLHYRGSRFLAERRDGEPPRIREDLQSGVELMGAPSLAGDAELLRLLLDAAGHLPLGSAQAPTLLIGHQGLLQPLLAPLEPPLQRSVREALARFDRLGLASLGLEHSLQRRLDDLLQLRGEPLAVLDHLSRDVEGPVTADLRRLVTSVQGQASALNIRLQLDPTFQPPFALYDGLVLELACRGLHAPVVIASGGRYDGLVRRFSPGEAGATGVGFCFAIEEVRQLLSEAGGWPGDGGDRATACLVAFAPQEGLEAALDRLQQLHRQGVRAELWPTPCHDVAAADAIARDRGLDRCEWLGGAVATGAA
jgi:ATP phosphoribosyltransferase regulatory subunit